MSMSHHTQVSKVSTVQQQSVPEPVALVPEPAPEYVVPKVPEPVFELQPEPEPVYEIIPEPQPVYEPAPEPEPVYEPIAEPEPAFELKPESPPVYETIPEPEPVYETIPEPAPVLESKPVPKFKPVQAPVPKPSPVKASPAAPPPPFDMVLPSPKRIIAQTQQQSVSQKVEEHVSTTKKVESTVSSSSVTKSVKAQKKIVAPTFKTRSLSAERPRVTEPVVLPPWSHEAPAIYWTSSVRLEEKMKPWTPPCYNRINSEDQQRGNNADFKTNNSDGEETS